MKNGLVRKVLEITGKIPKPESIHSFQTLKSLTEELTLRDEKLRENEERFREILENMIDASYKRNFQTNSYDYISPAVINIYGYNPYEMMNMGMDEILDHIHPEDLDSVLELKRKFENKEVDNGIYYLHYRFKHKDGRWINIEDRLTFIFGEDGTVLASIGTLKDITKEIEYSKKLKKSQAELDKLFELIDIQIWYLEDEETYGVCNKVHADLLGTTPEALRGKKLHEFLPSDVAEFCKAGNRKVFKDKVEVETREIYTDSTGYEHILAIKKTPVLDEKGNVLSLVCRGIDLSEWLKNGECVYDSEKRCHYEHLRSNLLLAIKEKNKLL